MSLEKFIISVILIDFLIKFKAFIIIIIIFLPRYSVPREWKKLSYAKKNQAGMAITPRPPS